MKKLLFMTTLILLTGLTFGQTLQKGNFIGFHVYTITLAPGVTMDQFSDFSNKKLNPEYEKVFQCKVYSLQGIRGECPNCIAGMVVWKTEADRDKFFNKEGSLTEAGQAAMAKIQPILDEMAKLGTATSKYTDWLVK